MSTIQSRKIFISYKYQDINVAPLSEYKPEEDTNYKYTPRHYVDKIIEVVTEDHIYKGEKSNESLDDFSDDTIDSKLKDKIFDSSVTIVLISPKMRDDISEKKQWIPNEIAYSLRDKTRGNKKSKSNAMLAVILPDYNNHYDYAVVEKECLREWQTFTFFKIISDNMFNRKNPNTNLCDICGTKHHSRENHSYIFPVKWDTFIKKHNDYIDYVSSLRDKIDEFNITKIF